MFRYEGGVPAGFWCVADVCRTTLEQGQVLTISHQNATLTSRSGDVLSTGVGIHQTALYDMFFATVLFLILYGMSSGAAARGPHAHVRGITGWSASSRTSSASTSRSSASRGASGPG